MLLCNNIYYASRGHYRSKQLTAKALDYASRSLKTLHGHIRAKSNKLFPGHEIMP